MSQTKNQAFTLIELLVVITIIAFLASIVLIFLRSSQIEARDISQIKNNDALFKAVVLFYDTNGAYPSTGLLHSGPLYEANSAGSNPYWPILLDHLSPWIQNFPKSTEVYYQWGYGYNPPNSGVNVNTLGNVCLMPGSVTTRTLVRDPKNVPQGSLFTGNFFGYGLYVLADGNYKVGTC